MSLHIHISTNGTREKSTLWGDTQFAEGLTLGQENISARRRDYRSYFSDISAEAVAIAHADDIRKFGYSFDSA